MEYSKIVAVSGLPGLFELVSSKSDGAIVRSLDDKSTRFVANRVHNFSHLESIEIYTVRENVNMVEVFQAMQASAEKLPDDKDAAAVKKYFEKVFPDMDFDRVYASDMKKMVKWFSIIDSQKIDFTPEPVEEEEEDDSEAEVKETKKPKEKEVKEVKATKETKETKEVKEPRAVKEVTGKKETAEAKAPAKKTAAKKTAAKKSSEKETEDKTKKTPAKKKS
jgi:hypothetical protein